MYSIDYNGKQVSLTEREAIIWNRLVVISMDGSNGDVSDFDDLGSRKSVGGVISSLVSKGLVGAEGTAILDRAGDVDLWPIHPEYGSVFWCDYLSDEEADKLMVRFEAAA
jgi:hypothetical protein